MLIYALGGGWGHLTRSVALARAVGDATVISNSPLCRRVAEPGVRMLCIDAMLGREATVRQVAHTLQTERFDTLVVDTFPRGLAGELVGVIDKLSCTKVLVHRDLSPRYVAARDVQGFLRHYDVVLCPGERGPLSDDGVFTAPWLLRDHHELFSRDAALDVLDADGGQPVVLVHSSADAQEAAEMERIAGQLARDGVTVRFAARWPALELMAGVDVVVGAGGYNTVHEARATGRTFIALARRRRYDRQRRRLDDHEVAANARDTVRLVHARLAFAGRVPRYDNGVHTALAALGRSADRPARPA